MHRLLKTHTVRWLLAGLLLVLLLPAVSSLPVRAGTLTVTTLADSGPGSLRQAIADAASGDSIDFNLPNPSTITLTTAALTLSKNVTIQGPGAAALALDGNHAEPVFTTGDAVEVTISGLTIQHGAALAGTCGTGRCGGGIFNQNGTLTVMNSTISDNSASEGGGGIYSAAGTLTVSDSVIVSNSASGIGSRGTLAVTHSYIAGNSAIFGGGIDNYSGTATVTDSTFASNGAGDGSGIRNGGTMIVTNSTFSSNNAVGLGTWGGGNGGAISNGGTLTVTNSTFSGNSASNAGGIGNIFGTVLVTSSTFFSNAGGAISNAGGVSNAGTVTVTNSTISGNSASNGGGIFNDATLIVTNSTISGNTATPGTYTYGGGIFNTGTLHLTNTIVAANTARVGPDIYGAVTTTGHNLLGTTSGSTGIMNGVNGDIVTPTPLLGTLGNYGGPTYTIPLLPGSPAIGQGDPAVCAATGAGLVNGLDQRGKPRPAAACAIGAYEAQIPAALPTPRALLATGVPPTTVPERRMGDPTGVPPTTVPGGRTAGAPSGAVMAPSATPGGAPNPVPASRP